jgi:DNA-binding CsgD family transcriptional regulator/energy-coupling factor transporter ATP-binding protein EcfA2
VPSRSAPRASVSPVGRADLLELAGASLDAGESVLVVGPAGIGKSTVLAALADRASSTGMAATGTAATGTAATGTAATGMAATGTAAGAGTQVLRAAAAEVESGLPYLTLVDLFGGALAEHGDRIPGHLRAALDAALLRTAPRSTAQDELAVRLAVLELLRVLAADRPVLLVIDDLQWVDEPSAGVLRFVARRVPDLAVAVLAAERITEPGAAPTRADLCPRPCSELTVGPLSPQDLTDLLAERFGTRLSRSTVDRVHAASGGNPLFAVELGRSLVERGAPSEPAGPLPVPERLRALVSARLAALPPDHTAPLLLVAAAARPTRALLERAGYDLASLGEATGAVGTPDARNFAAGVVELAPDGAVRFTHPLLREILYADAAPGARRAVHERLAGLLDDVVERARHLALARPDPDESLAETLLEAAAVARRRGAPPVAADLARLAADRTADVSLAATRRLSAARHAFAAGLSEEARALANAALREANERATRVGARLLLVELAGQERSGVGPLLDAAFVDADNDPGLVARVRYNRAYKAYHDGDTESVLAELKRAEQAAESADDLECLVEVLAMRGWVEAPFNVKDREEVMERVATLSRGLPLSSAVVNARAMVASACLLRGEVAEAVRRIDALRASVERSGTVHDLTVVLHTVASVYSRAGRCADALAAGRYCVRLFGDVVPTADWPGLLVGALVELGGGTVAQAAEYADRAVRASKAAGDEDWLKGAYAVQGQIQLLRGDPVAAVQPMRLAYQTEQRRGPVDPAHFLWHADFVEALAGAGARDEAAAVLAEVRVQTRRLERQVVELGLARAEAVLTAHAGDPRSAAARLAEELARWTDHPYPFEVARAWQALSTVERRAHRRGAAREALLQAIDRYTAIGAAPWLAAADEELARLDGARSAGLSATERRIVDLVHRGATNREIARATFLSIKAVEANLTRLYRRFGVRNREQLAQALADDD